MSEAFYCDRCGGLFNGPPAARVATRDGEFVLCGDCGDALAEWWEIPEGEVGDQSGAVRPASSIDGE